MPTTFAPGSRSNPLVLAKITSVLILASTLAACNSSSSDHDESYQTTATIDSQPVAFNGAFFTMPGYNITVADGREFIATDVRNYTHEWGFTVTTRIEVVTYAEPLADGPSGHITILDTVERVEDEIGTQYQYQGVYLNTPSVFQANEEEGYYVFLDHPVICSGNARCDQLADISDSGGSVSIQFEYIGRSAEHPAAVLLTGWN